MKLFINNSLSIVGSFGKISLIRLFCNGPNGPNIGICQVKFGKTKNFSLPSNLALDGNQKWILKDFKKEKMKR
jgi:hypothetical protein